MTKLLICWLPDYFSLILYFLISQIKLILWLKCLFLFTTFLSLMQPFLRSLLNLLQYCLCFILWLFDHKACEILAPWWGIEPACPALGDKDLTTGPPGKSQVKCFHRQRAGFPCGSAVKNPPAMRETWVQSLHVENPLEKEMATHSSILTWEIPWTEDPGGLQSMGSKSLNQPWLRD